MKSQELHQTPRQNAKNSRTLRVAPFWGAAHEGWEFRWVCSCLVLTENCEICFCFPGVFCVGESNSEWVWGSLMFNRAKSEQTLRDHGGPRQIVATLNLLEHARQCQILPQKAGFLLALYCLQKAQACGQSGRA